MQHRKAELLGRGGDQQIRDLATALTALGETSLSLQSALHWALGVFTV